MLSLFSPAISLPNPSSQHANANTRSLPRCPSRNINQTKMSTPQEPSPPAPNVSEGSKRYAALFARDPTAPVDVATIRATVERISRQCGGPFLSMRRVEDYPLVSLDGQSPFMARVYFPTLLDDEKDKDKKLGIILFSHGGGGMVGSVASYDSLCRRIATVCPTMAVVSVDYRLTPEHPFPAALEDMEAAYRFVVADLAAKQYPNLLDTTKLVVMGDSFGGHLAASLLLRLHRGQDPALTDPATWPKACILVYPSVHLDNTENPSFTTFGNVSHLTVAGMQGFKQAYLGDGQGGYRAELHQHPDVSVLYAPNLKCLPPTLLLSAACDPLIDEAGRFVQRLKEEEVSVKQVTYDGIIHGFLSGYEIFPEAELALQEVAAFVKEHVPC